MWIFYVDGVLENRVRLLMSPQNMDGSRPDVCNLGVSLESRPTEVATCQQAKADCEQRPCQHEPELGPLFTVTEEELSRPPRRREDRDVLVLRIEIEAQRREVARLMKASSEKSSLLFGRLLTEHDVHYAPKIINENLVG